MFSDTASQTEAATSAPAFPWWIVLVEGIFSIVEILLATTGTHWGWLLLMGILGVVRALFLSAGWGTGIMGMLSIIIAIFLFTNVLWATLALPLVIGACLLVGGLAAIFFSFRLRQA
jgi:uncharacterized membrane protein HdeD (DUF308 family)